MTKTYTFPGCWLHLNVAEEFLETVFPDGASLASVPVVVKDPVTAQRYGYGDDWMRLWREHDLLHHWVAVQFGLEYSPTIWAECHPDAPAAIPVWARRQEEEFLAAIHRWLNLDEWSPTLQSLNWLSISVEEFRRQAQELLASTAD